MNASGGFEVCVCTCAFRSLCAACLCASIFKVEMVVFVSHSACPTQSGLRIVSIQSVNCVSYN